MCAAFLRVWYLCHEIRGGTSMVTYRVLEGIVVIPTNDHFHVTEKARLKVSDSQNVLPRLFVVAMPCTPSQLFKSSTTLGR